MFSRHSRFVASIVLFFFTWTSGGLFSLAHGAVDAVKKGNRQEQQKQSESKEEKFSRLTEELRTALADPKGTAEAKRQRLVTARAEIDALDGDIRKQFADTEKKLKDAKLPVEILERHFQFVKHYDDNLAELKGNIGRVEKATTEAEVKVDVEKTLKHLERVKAPLRHQKLDPNNLPFRQPKVIKREPRLKKEEFERDFKKDKHAWKSARRVKVAANGPLNGLLPPDDLAETPEVQFTPEIRAKAQELGNSPVRIYEWVRNNVEFVPTWGSIQGAQMTLLTKQGNAFDTASLLIALLRAAGIKARYVTGAIELPIDKVMNWAGGFTNTMAALDFIASGGVPIRGGLSGGVITKAQLEHVWVEAYVPYGNYRGAARDQSIPTWIPLDASFKLHSIENGIDLTTTVPFDQDDYLANLHSMSPLHYYQAQIQSYLNTTMPDKSIVDLKEMIEITEEKYNFLPASLPYKTIVVAGKTCEIAAITRPVLTFRIKAIAETVDVAISLTTPELAGKRTTLSYSPASPGDEALVASYGGFMFDVPAYMLKVKPELKVEGNVVLTGEATTLGNDQEFTLQVDKPDGASEVANKKLVAGGYYSLSLDVAGINEGSLGNRNSSLRANITTLPPTAFSNDDLIGEHLYILGTTYFFANDKLYSSGSKLYNVAQMRTISGTFVSIIPSVSYVFFMPHLATPSGLEMDVMMDRITVVARNGSRSAEKSYMGMAGLVSSFNEHYIFEAIDGFSSVSTVKAIQAANADGIAIFKINAMNIEQVLPLMQVSQDVVDDVRNSVNMGREITVSQRNVQIDDWNGVGYVIKDPETGSGAYMISGGLAGAGTTNKTVGNQLVTIYISPYAWIKDRVDPQTQNIIATSANLAVGDYIGYDIKNGAETHLGEGYEDVSQCSGLVRLAYKAAGIYLDAWSGHGKDNLVTKFGITGTNGVSYHYNLANYLQINGSVRTTNDPLVGDIVFFSDTSGPGHPLNHEGIVISTPDTEGTIQFIDATRSAGVSVKKMNLLHPADSNYNTALARSMYPKKYAGELFSGFGTIRNK